MPIDPNMLAYFAASFGQGLMNPDDPMQQVAGATKQTIATKSYMDMVKQMLAGGGKFSMDKDKFKLDAPSALLGDDLFKDAPAGTAMNAPTGTGTASTPGGGDGTGMDMSKLMMLNLLGGGTLNPSASPLNISGVSLAGLTPENISQALQLKLMSEEVGRKKLSDIYKMMQPTKVEDPRTTKIKNYEYYKTQEELAGRKAKSIEEWDAGLVRERRLYDEAVASGMIKEENPFHEWLFDLRKAGRDVISIGEQAVQRGRGKGQAEVMAPGFAQSVKVDLMKDKANWPSDTLIKQYTDKGLPSCSEANDS